MLEDSSGKWIALGLCGQLLFFSRFVVQWIASEKARRSIVPNAFWYLSILGSLLLLAYSLYRRDLVFILGSLMGSLIYFRNLWLIYKTPH
jgi:lipid-A-disaccharide synthase-like uncharacterized protein